MQGLQVLSIEEDHVHQDISPHYHALESGSDGKPGGILMVSVAQQVLPGLWVGGYTALESQRFLKNNNITHILTLGKFKWKDDRGDYCNKIIEIPDHPEAEIIRYFPETYAFIDAALSCGQRVLVHCLGGISRSPTIAAAYWMKKCKLRHKEALALIAQNRPFIHPNQGFLDQLRLYREMDYDYHPLHPAYLTYKETHPMDAILDEQAEEGPSS
ncbi:protein-tyrosine phosphatase-like protein [Spinellus fusiger]|nr:protein-tyrosine phosphatase-like protein [Spinellus fusiger]